MNDFHPDYRMPSPMEEAPTIMDYLWRYLVFLIPFLGIGAMIYFAVSQTQSQAIKNWARANLILTAVLSILYFFLFVTLLAGLGAYA
jgi:hypothetical protein